MNKDTIINIWLNNFTDVGFTKGSYIYNREQKYKSLYRKLTLEQAKQIDNLHLFDCKKWDYKSFCKKLQELGY